ncbi:hypothetical protein ACH5RR_001273 [Cinchona calisaya]|uniref:Uncharacterized protein n=1 Tax=Cinchona calisaya TaxID=153742 RepID=A0ABD3B2X3_9GENT
MIALRRWKISSTKFIMKLADIFSPFGSNWRARPNSIGKDGTAKYVDDIGEKQSEAYPQTYKGTNPMFDNEDMYHEGPMTTSKPTNNFGSAVDFLAEAVNPPYGGKDSQTNNLSRPIKTGPLSSIHWRTGTNLAAQDRQVDTGEVREDDLDKPKEQQIYGRNKEDKIPRLPTNPYNNKEVDQKANGNNGSVKYISKPAASPEPSQQTRFPEETYMGTINCNDAVKKYNGAKVPW